MKINNPKYILSFLISSLSAVLFFSGAGVENKLSSRLEKNLLYSDSQSKMLVWVFFKDKGESDISKEDPSQFLTEKSIERRIKRNSSMELIDRLDLPVNTAYISAIIGYGIKIKQVSKWFNGISCYATKMQIMQITEKSFVKEIDIVQRYQTSEFNSDKTNLPENHEIISSDKTLSKGSDNNQVNVSEINYGPSYNQSNLINVPSVHEMGYTGNGILIASFDAGFDNLNHNCFNRAREKGIRTFDFVNGDTIVANGIGRKGNGAHGTQTLSLVCGYDPGWFISPAFDSEIILAKTENTESETPLEEDNWIAAAEWADSLGADIITSSVTYKSFNEPYVSYTWEDMDGMTARITIAADIAVNKGIIVVSSAGNAGFDPDHNTLGAPADGRKVITAGAVTLSRQRAGFSSVGPTADGRIKPDVMALGVSNYTAFPGNGNVGYVNSSTGTSFSCPMIAGVCALMLSANPNLSPEDVKSILLSSSDRNGQPNNLTGWGVVNAFSAVKAAIRFNTSLPEDFTLEQNYPNPFNPSTTIKINLKKSGVLSIIVYDVLGRNTGTIINNEFFNAGNYKVNYNPESNGLQSGVYFYTLTANGLNIDTKKFIYLK